MKEREEVVASGDDMEKEAMPPLEPMPVSEDLPSLLEIASSNPDFTLLNAAVSTQPDIVELIQGDGPFTIFAPVNSAFENWLEENNLSAEEALSVANAPRHSQETCSRDQAVGKGRVGRGGGWTN